jgi:hypothetical protein
MHAPGFRRGALRAGIAAAVFAAALIATATADATVYTWNVSMDGQQQIDSGLPARANATGSANITADTAANRVCGQFFWQNVTPPVGFGHIHQARPGQPENPGFTINLFGPPTDTNGFQSGVIGCTIVPAAVIDEMADKSSFFMVTIHNLEFPAGAIRGQLASPGRTIFCDLGTLCPGP